MTQPNGYTFPKRGDEYWKFTRPEPFAEIASNDSKNPPSGVSQSVHGTAELFADYNQYKVVVDDSGVEVPQFLNNLKPSLEIRSSNNLKSEQDSKFQNNFCNLEKSLDKPIPRPFARYCIDNSRVGFSLLAKQKVPVPIVIDYSDRLQGKSELFYNRIKIEKGAELTLIEIGNPWSSANHVIEIEVNENGCLNHFRVLHGNDNATTLTHQFSTLAQNASLSSFTYNGNVALTRNEYIVELNGDNGNAFVSGIFAGRGSKHHDDTVFVNHKGLHCTSRQVFKKVLDDGAVGVFQGKILVDPGSQKTDGYQKSQALLLDPSSQFLVKPELEIYADDVSCSHGSTCGSIDEDSLFYLRSRGIPKRQAVAILAESFLAEVFSEFDNQYVTETLGELLSSSLVG